MSKIKRRNPKKCRTRLHYSKNNFRGQECLFLKETLLSTLMYSTNRSRPTPRRKHCLYPPSPTDDKRRYSFSIYALSLLLVSLPSRFSKAVFGSKVSSLSESGSLSSAYRFSECNLSATRPSHSAKGSTWRRESLPYVEHLA